MESLSQILIVDSSKRSSSSNVLLRLRIKLSIFVFIAASRVATVVCVFAALGWLSIDVKRSLAAVGAYRLLKDAGDFLLISKRRAISRNLGMAP